LLHYQNTGMAVDERTKEHGFTLLELLIVAVLISIMLAVSVPAFRSSLFTDPLKLSARQVIGTMREAKQRAVSTEKGCELKVDIEANSLSLFCPQPPQEEDQEKKPESETERVLSLPSQVKITSVFDGAQEEHSTGAVSLWINNRGLMEPAIINLSDGSDEIGLAQSPFISTIQMADQSLEPAKNEG
jgi:prepilin-type N-terminal cleavage/methylation domain-containing protein